MATYFRVIPTLSVLALAGYAALASASCNSGSDAPSQLRLVDPKDWEPSMQSTIATHGFPAISASGAEIATLKTIDAAESSSVLDVVDAKGGELLKRFVLFPEHAGLDPHSEKARHRLAAEIIEPNKLLTAGAFKPMDVLFDEQEIRVERYAPFWETVSHGLHVRYESEGSILQIASVDDEGKKVRLEWPARVLDPAGPDGMIQCGVQGVPVKAWIDPTGAVIVLRVLHAGGPADGCDRPEEWRVEPLPSRS